jgi:hypothetical protein
LQENSPAKFKWSGGNSAIFKGDHVFEFLSSRNPNNIGGTTFLHYEDFKGMFAHTMKPEKRSGEKNFEGFNAFNRDLKRRCEGGSGNGYGGEALPSYQERPAV